MGLGAKIPAFSRIPASVYRLRRGVCILAADGRGATGEAHEHRDCQRLLLLVVLSLVVGALFGSHPRRWRECSPQRRGPERCQRKRRPELARKPEMRRPAVFWPLFFSADQPSSPSANGISLRLAYFSEAVRTDPATFVIEEAFRQACRVRLFRAQFAARVIPSRRSAHRDRWLPVAALRLPPAGRPACAENKPATRKASGHHAPRRRRTIFR